jgi:hypothetical protein
MTDITTGAEAPSGETAAPVTTLPLAPPKGEGPLTIRQAAREYAQRREEGAKQATETTEQPRVNGKFAAAQTQSDPGTGEDAAAETPSGEEQGAEAGTPPIEPPNSWTKAEKERFTSLPRETQEYLAQRESARDAELNRRQQETAERSKALEAKETAADQARQQYESAAQNALQVLQQQQASEFADIRTHADVNKLATDDPFRFAQWQARQMQIQAQAQEVQQLTQQREQEKSKTFEAWSKEQDDKFTKQFPEFADPEKGTKVRTAVTSYLTKEVGVPEAALQKLWGTDLFRDAMWQRVVYDASRFHAAQQAAKSAVQAPKPQVQRPGTVSTKAERSAVDIGALEKKLDNATSTRSQIAAAAALRAAKRSASAH